ncbi:MAG: ATP-dependent DNA helicase RecG [Bacteroidales bacterium]|nr:ATP-dependent DNA helicase RecG [Bacteroidales bacterium]
MSEFSKIDIKFLAGVGPKRAEILKKEIGVATYEDLLYYFPYKYIDRSKIFKINEIDGNFPYIQIEGEIISYEEVGTGRAKRLSATFSDGTGTIELVWFKGAKYIKENYRLRTKYTVFGKPAQYGSKISIAHPEIDKVEPFTERKHTLQGYYSTTEEMKKKFINSKTISKLIESIFRSLKVPIFETISIDVAKECNLININDALRNIHFPKSNEELQKATFRLKFEELFYIQLNILRYMKLRERSLNGFKFKRIGDNVNNFYKYNLPFELTNAQKRVIKEIRYDMGSGKQMNRLLQGDVGSGKTLVAIMSMLIASDNDFQACIMAPTEILATQHYENIKRLLSGLNINIALLTGSTKKSERDAIDKGLKDGTINFIVGTHALIEDNVIFKNLGLVIVDEQHRFGVVQRSKLWKKNNQPPHVLVMTATPIPRTLAMTLYGDLDVSVIDELPPGRKPISTILRFDSGADKMYNGIRKQIEAGRQIYIVYPLIKESEKSDLKNLEEGYNYVKNLFKEYEVCMVHGKMKSSEKEEEMQKFASGRAKIMVATTVIEVGVDVPNASVMVIENAERFGLAQLHQLRGRVGRGAEQSYCILKTTHKLSENSRKRLDIMCKTNDGFEIAEADLKLRGPGDMEGTQQSGMAFDLKIANITRDAQILQLARDCASRVLDIDPDLSQPEHLILKIRLDKLFKRIVNFGLVG